MPCASTHKGFSLVEIAIVLVIVGLLLGGLLMPLSAQVEGRRISETQKAMDEINQALTGFAIANGRLPCPASGAIATGAANAGMEQITGTACSASPSEGVLPWATLGVSETDAWGRRYGYRVTALFARGIPQTTFGCSTASPNPNPNPPSNPTRSAFALCSPGDIDVRDAATGNVIADNVPALVISYGPNGLGAYTSAGTQIATSGAGADEAENADADAIFVSHVPSSAAANKFDDLVAWLSPNTLFNRMVSAQILP